MFEEMRMEGEKTLVKCFLCRREVQFGPHVYNGKTIPPWDIFVCDTCYQANWDGIVPGTFPHLIAHLKSKSIEIRPNKRGWIDWPV
jgi:hypothetical protein